MGGREHSNERLICCGEYDDVIGDGRFGFERWRKSREIENGRVIECQG
jgi:hypothetical protein